MDDQKISVTLTGPAKIAGKHEPPGKTVTVSHTLALQLAASCAIDPVAAQALSQATGGTVGTSEFDAAVAEIQRQADERIAQFEASFKEKEELAARAMQYVEANCKVNLDALSKALTDAEEREKALKAENAALTKLVRDHEAAETLAKADIATLTASLTTETNARIELEAQFADAEKLGSELKASLDELRQAKDELEAAATELNAQKAGKKSATSKD